MNRKTQSFDERAKLLESPVLVERKALERIRDALGEISQNMTWFRKQLGPCDETVGWSLEAIVEAQGLLHGMFGCFNPDSFVEDDEDDDTEGEAIQ